MFISDTAEYINEKAKEEAKQKHVIVNLHSLDLMDKILNYTKSKETKLDNYFTKEPLICVNKCCKESNYFAFDKYGLVIRRNDYNNSKTIFGWIYDKFGDPISIHIDPILIKTNSENIYKLTLEKLHLKYPNEFKERKIYTRIGNNLGINYN